ncbi:hypothetical protein NW762_014155 [Fusarium torreyae]|uniref:Major facilitator superfamily (MFS) profile domain-containing protein n=1 Tax=Fusarium torreyae TaxID=1237075 RepID=A0A9W8RM70_9HYPO|nr:hypothetical protein NW762_014155 [Fusarium torreyae]
MEGYDMKLIGSLNAQPAFTRKHGHRLPNGDFEITATWQAGLSNGASVGFLIGLYLNGRVSERLGFKRAMLVSLSFMTCAIFIPYFAPSVEVLLVFGQFLSAGVLRVMADRTDQWAYRIPFAIQWIWPVPLITAISFAPESPWWCVRKGRVSDAKVNLRRLVNSQTTSEESLENMVKLMEVTVAHEREAGTGKRYIDCFHGVNRRQTMIACCTWGIQILSGTGLRTYATYFYHQAGLPTTQAFNMSLVQYALGIIGVWVSWLLLPHFGRRTMYIWGLVGLELCLLTMGALGTRRTTSTLGWVIGSMLIVYTLVYDVTVGPICYALVSEVPASELRSKTVVLARMTYNMLNIVSNVITPYMLNPSAWAWGAKTGFFFAGTCFVSLIFTLFCIPETKNRTYAELNVLFQKRTKAWNFAEEKITLDEQEQPYLTWEDFRLTFVTIRII